MGGGSSLGSIRFALFAVLPKCRYAQNSVLPNLGETENCAERVFWAKRHF